MDVGPQRAFHGTNLTMSSNSYYVHFLNASVAVYRARILRMFMLPVFLFVVPDLRAQTSIVVFRTDTAIFAAADSKASSYDKQEPTVTCKFFKAGELFFSISGLYFDGYSEIVTNTGMNLHAIRSSSKNFEKVLLPLLRDALEKMRREYPEKYSGFMHSDKPDIDFTFLGMNRRIPVVSIVVFHVQESGTSIVVSVAEEHFLDELHCPGGNLICGFESGNNKAITAYQSKNPNWWNTKNYASLVRKLVQLEIDAVPAHVGPPIRVLQIDAKGRHWIQHGEGCDKNDR